MKTQEDLKRELDQETKRYSDAAFGGPVMQALGLRTKAELVKLKRLIRCLMEL